MDDLTTLTAATTITDPSNLTHPTMPTTVLPHIPKRTPTQALADARARLTARANHLQALAELFLAHIKTHPMRATREEVEAYKAANPGVQPTGHEFCNCNEHKRAMQLLDLVRRVRESLGEPRELLFAEEMAWRGEVEANKVRRELGLEEVVPVTVEVRPGKIGQGEEAEVKKAKEKGKKVKKAKGNKAK